MKGQTKNQISSPTGWLRMHVWRLSLRRTKSAIISGVKQYHRKIGMVQDTLKLMPKTMSPKVYLSQLMRLWYLSHRDQRLRRAFSSEPSLFAYTKYGSRRKVWPKIRHLAPLDGCACVFEGWVTGDENCHYLGRWLIWTTYQEPFPDWTQKGLHG